MIAHNSFASSTSKPIRLPEASLEFQGGYAPSVPIVTWSALEVIDKNKEIKIPIPNIFNLFIFPPKIINLLFHKKIDLKRKLMIYRR
tara:strand:- start:6804 stop:7064 length:261 start_codon:yes stop_codon:yes gene_type:complete